MIVISPKILEKLFQKHGVTDGEVHQCFENRSGHLLVDDREQHRTDPSTTWVRGSHEQGPVAQGVLHQPGWKAFRSIRVPAQ